MGEITQVITEYTGTVPDKATQTPSVFSAAADAFVDFMEGMPAEENAFANQANTLRTDCNTAMAGAETAQTASEAAKDIAVAAANATLYDTGKTGGYSVGDVVYSVSGEPYRCIQAQAEGVVQSLTSTSYWFYMMYAPSAEYKSIYVDAGAMVPSISNGAEAGTEEYATTGKSIDYFAFDGATWESVQFKIAMPEDWDLSTIKVKFNWSSATGSTTGDGVSWGARAIAMNDGDSIETAWGDTQSTNDILSADNGANMQTTPPTASITVGSVPAADDLTVFQAFRNVDNATDTMPEDAWLFGMIIQYKTSTDTVVGW